MGVYGNCVDKNIFNMDVTVGLLIYKLIFDF